MTAPGVATTAAPTARRARLPGPDVVRGVALIGVAVMNYHGYLIHRGSPQGDGAIDRFFDPWTGPLSTRFAATFVVTAGVGVTLLTRSSVGDPIATARRRLTLLRRGAALYVFGLAFNEIWDGTILLYYGAMFMLAAALFTLGDRWIVVIGVGAAVAGAAVHAWVVQRGLDGHPTTWLTAPAAWSPADLLFGVVVNGTHPLLPWLAFLCAGIIVGRVLGTAGWRLFAVGIGLVLVGISRLATGWVDAGPLAMPLTSDDPFDRGLVYTASALGTALAAFAVVSWVADRFPRSLPVDVLRHAGAMTLTLYVGHALVFNLIVDWLGWIRPTGLDTALAFAAGYWLAALAAGWWWHRTFGLGPLEWVYRKLGG